MLKGADRNMIDFDAKRPIDYVPSPEAGEHRDIMALELRTKILNDEWTIMGDCLMIRNAFKKQKKSPLTLIFYFFLMSISFGLLELSSYDILRVSD